MRANQEILQSKTIDLMRFICAFMVVLVHSTGGNGMLSTLPWGDTNAFMPCFHRVYVE